MVTIIKHVAVHSGDHQITLSICSSGCYKSHTAAKQNLKLMI